MWLAAAGKGAGVQIGKLSTGVCLPHVLAVHGKDGLSGNTHVKDAAVLLQVQSPKVALKIIDEAIQVHGAHGLSQDCKLTDEYIHVRHVRFADGPDAVHLREVAKDEMKKEPSMLAVQISGVNPNIEKYGKFATSKL